MPTEARLASSDPITISFWSREMPMAVAMLLANYVGEALMGACHGSKYRRHEVCGIEPTDCRVLLARPDAASRVCQAPRRIG